MCAAIEFFRGCFFFYTKKASLFTSIQLMEMHSLCFFQHFKGLHKICSRIPIMLSCLAVFFLFFFSLHPEYVGLHDPCGIRDGCSVGDETGESTPLLLLFLLLFLPALLMLRQIHNNVVCLWECGTTYSFLLGGHLCLLFLFAHTLSGHIRSVSEVSTWPLKLSLDKYN